MTIQYQPTGYAIRNFKSISFAGCGALNFYQTGVGYGLQESGLAERFSYCGASAGAGLAFTMAAGFDARQVCATMTTWIVGFGSGRVLRPAWAFQIANRFGSHFVNEASFARSTGRIGVSITQQRPLKNQVVQSFTSTSDLQNALVASCFLPFPRQLSVNFRATPSMDGGFSNNQPILDDHTLKVSPFWFDMRAHLRPSPGIAASRALRVPTESQCWSLFNRGLEDFRQWMNRSPLSGIQPKAMVVSQLKPKW